MDSPGKDVHLDGHDECNVPQRCRVRCAFIPVDYNFGRLVVLTSGFTSLLALQDLPLLHPALTTLQGSMATVNPALLQDMHMVTQSMRFRVDCTLKR